MQCSFPCPVLQQASPFHYSPTNRLVVGTSELLTHFNFIYGPAQCNPGGPLDSHSLTGAGSLVPGQSIRRRRSKVIQEPVSSHTSCGLVSAGLSLSLPSEPCESNIPPRSRDRHSFLSNPSPGKLSSAVHSFRHNLNLNCGDTYIWLRDPDQEDLPMLPVLFRAISILLSSLVSTLVLPFSFFCFFAIQKYGLILIVGNHWNSRKTTLVIFDNHTTHNSPGTTTPRRSRSTYRRI